jgi:rfaE bifunctional protein kinase chain/domain
MNTERLNAMLSRFPDLTILVVGDFFLDKYLIIEHRLAETSLETGLEAHQVVEVRCQPGAAGTVTNNLRAMGLNVLAAGVVGDDGEGFELIRGLWKTGVDVDALVVRPDRFTPTYTKPMLREPDGAAAELNRLDIKNRMPLPAEAEDELITRLRGLLPRVHGVIIADQVPEEDCGAITERVREELCALARAYPTVAFIADSRERIGLFEDIMLKPNAREAIRAVHSNHTSEPDRDVAEASAATLYQRSGQPVFLTLGAGGIMAFHADGPTHVSAVPVTGPIDIVGAGDATMAGITSALCAGATVAEAAQIGCLAAAVTIQQIGTTGTASTEQMAACFKALPSERRPTLSNIPISPRRSDTTARS